MKKILIFLFMIMCLCGCGCNKQTTNTPKGEVAKLFSNYNSLNIDVLIQLDSVMSTEALTDSEKAKYKDVLKRQYEDLNYTIKDEVITDDKAVVTAEIEVYDLKKVMNDADKYLEENNKEFLKEGSTDIDTSKFWDYKLDKMFSTKDRTTYVIDFTLTKIDDKWVLDDLLEADRQKIHGLYKG